MKTKYIIGLVVAGIMLLYGLIGIRTVKANQVCVRTSFGEVKGFETSGLTWVAMGKDKLICTTTSQVNFGKDDGYDVSTKDMQTVIMFVKVNYAVDSGKIEDLFKNFVFKHQDLLVSPIISDVVQGVSARYTIEELIEKRDEIANIMQEEITTRLGNNGIVVFDVNIINHDFSDSYEASVEAKKVAEQSVLKAQQELLEAQIQAEKNKTISQTFTPELATKLFLEKWNGALPTYWSGEGNPIDIIVNGQ